MFLIIEDRNRFRHFLLDKEIRYRGIIAYRKDDAYYISLIKGWYFSDGEKVKKINCHIYEVNTLDIYYQIKIYVYENFSGIDDFSFYENRRFILSVNKEAGIVSKNPYLDDYYLLISDGTIQSNYDIYIDDKKYDGQKLKEGEMIELLGHRIIYFENFLYINHFYCDIRLAKYQIFENRLSYQTNIINKKYLIAKEAQLPVIPKLKKYTSRKDTNNIRNIIPNISMTLMMFIMAFLNIRSRNIGQYESLTYILMPVSMFISGILFPLIFYFLDRIKRNKEEMKNKDDYLNYLKSYQNNVNKLISQYLQNIDSQYYIPIDRLNQRVCILKSSSSFWNISIGKTDISFPFEYESSGDKDIDNALNNINNSLTSIVNHPLFINLNDYHSITIICKSYLKQALFMTILLEVAYKHHHDDLAIAIYHKDQSLINDFYNLPHLFNDGLRMTYTDHKQLQNLVNYQGEKEVILFNYDEDAYLPINNKIKTISFTDRSGRISQNSDLIIEYNINTGTIYGKKITDFYYYPQDLNYQRYFNYLGRYHKIRRQIENYDFNYLAYSLHFPDNYCDKKEGLKAYFAYDENGLVGIDLSEEKDGPHGLIGGSTGSGKSELLVSFLLSLCIRYSPDYLNIILIDYKGGGIKESLSYSGRSVPHIVASISNLDNYVIERLIITLRKECEKRQRLFKKLTDLNGFSIMNIDDYLNADKKGFGLNDLAHLLIVIDEFAELKKNNPELIKDLISISRIGRSLGIHLILATQKPAGSIDEEIWSNSRFKIALKVYEEKDSLDLLKRKDATFLKQAGDFILKVDDTFIKAKSIYAKKDYRFNDPYELSILDNTLSIKKNIRIADHDIISQATYYSKRIIDICEKNNYQIQNFIFNPPVIKSRYEYASKDKLIMGVLDDYYNSNNEILSFDIEDNLLICSKRNDEIKGIINNLTELNRQTILIAKTDYRSSCISDSLLYDESDDITYLFEDVFNENLRITLLIEDLSVLLAYDTKYLDILIKLIKKSHAGNYNIIALTNDSKLPYRLLNCFEYKFLIGSNDHNDISYFFGMKTKYLGDSFYYKNEPIAFIPVGLETLNEDDSVYPRLIEKIPEIIKANIKDDTYLIGYDLKRRKKIYTDKNILITSLNYRLLERYKRAYNNLNIRKYDNSLTINNYRKVLWLGSNIFNQRIISTNRINDLKNDEGLYMDGDNVTLLRIIDDA